MRGPELLVEALALRGIRLEPEDLHAPGIDQRLIGRPLHQCGPDVQDGEAEILREVRQQTPHDP